MTSLLAHATGTGGRVVAFEPHPVVFSRLSDNAAQWTGLPPQPAIELRQAAASDIVFEERGEAPTPVTWLLEEYGYALIALGAASGTLRRSCRSGQSRDLG